MRRISPPRVTGAAVIVAALACSSAALAAPGISWQALDVQALNRLQRVGVAILGTENRESIAARDFAAKSLVKAGHPVVGLPTFATDPSPDSLVGSCEKHDLDAVALVRISTDAQGWRVNVDIRDADGRSIAVTLGDRAPHDMFTGSGEGAPTFATFSFAMSADDVAAQQRARDQELRPEPPATADADARTGRPHLFVKEKVVMYGPAQLQGAEFYRLVGRPDLAATYEHNRSSIKTVRGFGYTALGIGGTTLVLALAAAAVTPAACALPNTVDALNGQQASCGDDVGALFMVPLAFGATGAVLLATASTMTADPLSLSERRVLAREYNARVDSAAEQLPAATRPPHPVQLTLSGAPLPKADGGLMLLTGRF
jgi:hypothetical protein